MDDLLSVEFNMSLSRVTLIYQHHRRLQNTTSSCETYWSISPFPSLYSFTSKLC